MTNTPTVKLSDISIGYDGHVILKDLSLSINPGEFVALVGPNGSGKTTLLRAILGLEPLQKGSREVLGVNNPKPEDLAGKMVYIPQRMGLNRTIPVTVREFFELRRRSTKIKMSAEEALQTTGLSSDILDKSLHDLSGGQMQRVFIAYALLGKPMFFGLDEVTEGLDYPSQQSLFKTLKARVLEDRAALLLVSHDISHVTEFASRVICLDRSVQYDGDPKASEFHMCLHKVYGERSLIHDHRHSH